MARKKKFIKKNVEVKGVQEIPLALESEKVEVKDVKVPKDTTMKETINKMSWVYNEKEALIKSIKELVEHRDRLAKDREVASEDLSNAYKKLQHAGNDLRGLVADIDSAKKTAEQKLSRECEEIKRRLEQIKVSDKLMQAKIKELDGREKSLEAKEISFTQSSRAKEEQVNSILKDAQEKERRSKSSVDQANQLHAKLSERMKEFDLQRSEIKKENELIKGIKSENERLKRKVEADAKELQLKIQEFTLYKEDIDKKHESEKKNLKDIELTYISKMKEIEKRNELLNDKELETKALQAEIQRLVKRYKLEEAIEKAKG